MAEQFGYQPDGKEEKRFEQIDGAMSDAGIRQEDYMPSADAKVVFVQASALKPAEPQAVFACDPYPWDDEWPVQPESVGVSAPKHDPFFPLQEEGVIFLPNPDKNAADALEDALNLMSPEQLKAWEDLQRILSFFYQGPGGP